LDSGAAKRALDLAQRLQSAASFALPAKSATVDDPNAMLDAIVTEPELRDEVRKLFLDGHYPQAVEEGFKYLNNLVKRRTGSEADGAGLMTSAFSVGAPLLRLPKALKTESQKNQQQGYMLIFQGSMIGVRNPRAHEHAYLDDPRNALELLALCNHLVRVTSNATRARAKRRTT
jgi:uncharacterized protein (TIGR02391 family)